jgi:hypothetical protein
LRAILSAGFSFAILLASIWLDIWPFPNLGFIGVSMTDDEVRDFMVFVVGVLTVLAGAPYLAGSAAAVLPVPLAYAGLGVLAATEFSLRRAIEPNRGRFIAICALFGAIAIFVKLSVH